VVVVVEAVMAVVVVVVIVVAGVMNMGHDGLRYSGSMAGIGPILAENAGGTQAWPLTEQGRFDAERAPVNGPDPAGESDL
jgi:hypothetical protein